MGRLSTHVLDTATGRPAHGLRIDFSIIEAGATRLIKTIMTNTDGRTDAPLMQDQDMRTGEFEILFHVGDYFRAQGLNLPAPAFIDRVPIRFGIADRDAHYHVPLLATPWSYSTYRGS